MKLIISIGFLTFLLSPFITSAQTTPSMDETIAEESTNTVVVNTGRDSKINVRETTGGKRLGTQKNGAVGVIIDGPVIVKKRSWHKIDFITGVDGWVVSSMLEMQAEPAPAFLLISQSVESVTDTTALITYQLSEAGTGQIEYGTTQNLGTLNNKDNSLNYSIHRQTLLNLTPKTTYYYQITSENAAGVSVTSDIKSFTTNAPPVYAFSNGDTITVNTGDGSNINIRATANGTLLGQQPDSALGTVVGGPVTTGSFVWWNIDFNSGVDGWAAEDFIQAYVPPAPAPTPPSITTDKTTYAPGETITVTVAGNETTLDAQARAELALPGQAATEGAYNQVYQYLDGTKNIPTTARQNATLTFTAPSEEGQYVFELYGTILFSNLLDISNVITVDAVAPPTTPTPPTSGPVKAFPEAEGHGAESIGGRGGIVVKVTNLNDSGPGSLREALLMTVPRIIVFDVSGTIDLQSRIRLSAANSYFTLAGQTAPGDGITVRNHQISFSGVEHAIMRHIRIRHGCPEGCDISTADSINIFSNSNNIVLDHVSMTWSSDEAMSIWGSNIKDITIQWSLIAEGNFLCRAPSGESGHNLGPLLSGGTNHTEITFANNYLAHMCYRNTKQDGGYYEYINNVSYNNSAFEFNFSQNHLGGPDSYPDVIGHYFKQGPQSRNNAPFDIARERPDSDGPWNPISLHLSDITAINKEGNTHSLYSNGDPYSLIKTRYYGGASGPGTWSKRTSPHSNQPAYPVAQVSSTDAPAKVLPTVGASLPKRDPVDTRIVGDFYDGGIWSESNIRQYPVMNTYNVKPDSDNDGMPDDWETANGLNPLNGDDHSGDSNGDGYTNIENYINSIGVSETTPAPAPTTPTSNRFSNGDTITVNTGDGSNINIRATANGTLLGQQPDSALGTVVGGPVTTGSFVWWNIDFNSGVDGWAAEDFIQAYVPPAPAPTPAPATLLFEAESMLLSSPMQTKQTEGETVIYSSTAGAGTAIKIITIPSTGLYNLRVHAKTPNTGSDSFYFTIGTNAQRTFSTPINTSLAWITYSAGLSLTEGNTTLTILTREPNVEIDKVELVPVGSSAQ